MSNNYNPYQRYAVKTVLSDQNAIGNALDNAFKKSRSKKQKQPKPTKPAALKPVPAPKFKPTV